MKANTHEHITRNGIDNDGNYVVCECGYKEYATPNPTPTTLRALLSEIVDEAYAIMDSKSFADPYAKGIKQLEEQLKALLPEKKPVESTWVVLPTGQHVQDKDTANWYNGFNSAIDQIQKAIDDFCSGKGKE